MPVTLTLSLPDLRPVTIRAAFDALFPPEPMASAPEPPAEPEHALLRAARAAIAEGVSLLECSLALSWAGTPQVRVDGPDFRRVCGGLPAEVSFGRWTVLRDGVEWSCWLTGEQDGAAVVPFPEPVAKPVVEPDDAPPRLSDDLPF